MEPDVPALYGLVLCMRDTPRMLASHSSAGVCLPLRPRRSAPSMVRAERRALRILGRVARVAFGFCAFAVPT
eukprot:4645192-Prymnesium_polylepis.1